MANRASSIRSAARATSSAYSRVPIRWRLAGGSALLTLVTPRGMAPLRVGDLTLNPDTHEVARGDRSIELTQREFELLEYLMRNERLVISRQKLLDEVWGYDPFSITNTIEVFVSNLRARSSSRNASSSCSST